MFLFGDELMYNKEKSLTKQLLTTYNENNCSVVSATTCPIEESYKYGMLEIVENKLKKIVEKPRPENSPSNICFLGNSVFTPQIFKYIVMNKVGETGVVDSINEMVKDEAVSVCMVEGNRFDVGNKLGLVKANLFYGLQDEEISKELKEYMLELLEK